MPTQFIPTGLAGLDSILGGGLRPASVVIVEGLPGTGKTLLASEMAARSNEPTLYLSFEITKSFFDECFENFQWKFHSSITFEEASAEDLVASFKDGDTKESALETRIRATGIKRLVIDSLAPLDLLFEDRPRREYRDFLQSLFKKIRSLGVTAIVITESSPSRLLGETGASTEQFLADTVITLRKSEQRRGLLRSIEIAKSRGQNVLLGRHSFRINDSGVTVYPRAYSRQRVSVPHLVSEQRTAFGIAGLEEMLGGGVYIGSSTLIVGITGTGKTVAAMQFLNEGLQKGENCLLVSLDDSAEQICFSAAQLGFHFQEAMRDGRLTVVHESPVEIELDAHFNDIEEAVRARQCTRVVIDSVATYETLLPNECNEFLIALSAFLRSVGSTSVFAYETPELLGISQISEKLKASALADNIILLNYVEISTTLRRAITVPKTRASKPDQQTREYIIKTGGIALLDESTVPQQDRVPQLPLSCYYGVLARSPTRHSPIIDESVAAGKPMPKSKIPKPVRKSKDSTDKNSAKPSVN